MSVIKSSPVGEARGKVGAIVYTRHKNGLMIRGYTSPVQPNSTPQLNARSAFAAASAAWNTLTLDERTSWDEFGANPSKFIPEKARTSGARAGRSAFIALYMNCYNKSTLSSPIYYTREEFGNVITGTYINYNPESTAPHYNLSGNFSNGAGSPIPFYVANAYAYVSSKYIKVHFKTDSRYFTADGTVDEFGNKFGFALYLSEPMVYVNSHPKNDLYMCIAATRPISSCGGAGFTDVNNFWIYAEWSGSFSGYKFPPAAGEVRKLTVFAISSDGMRKRLGNIWLTLNA